MGVLYLCPLPLLERLQDFRNFMSETKKDFLLTASVSALPAVMLTAYDVGALAK